MCTQPFNCHFPDLPTLAYGSWKVWSFLPIIVSIIVCAATSQPAAESAEKNWAGLEHGGDFNSLGWTPQHCYRNAGTADRLCRTSQFSLIMFY